MYWESGSGVRRTRSGSEGKLPIRTMPCCPAVECVSFATILSRDGEGRTDRDGRNGDASAAGNDVSGRSSRPAQRAGAYFRENAEAFYSDRAGR